MSELFKIKYSIFEDDIEEFRNMKLEEFEKEYTHIYGMFTLVFGGNQFIQYLDEEDQYPLEAKHIFSELITTYFDALIYITDHLDDFEYLYLKYIENRSTWLELHVEENEILVSSLKVGWDVEMNNELKNSVSTERGFFESPKEIEWDNVRIRKDKFKIELNESLYNFLKEIKAVNQSILSSKLFSKQLEYLHSQGKELL